MQWTMLYESTILSLVFSLDYLLLRYGQGQGLRKCQKPKVIVMFRVFENIFSAQICRSLE